MDRTRISLRCPKAVDAHGWVAAGEMKPDYRARLGYPRRQAVRYNVKESYDMVAQFVMGFNVSEIAAYHERTENGVYVQLEHLGAFKT